MGTLLIHGGTVITMDPERRVYSPGAIVINGTRIADIGKETEVLAGGGGGADAKRIDASGCLVLPGLVDTHYHVCQQFYRGITFLLGERGHQPRAPHWKNYLVPSESRLTADDVRLSAEAAYVNLIRVGTTCVSEHGGRNFPDIIAQAMKAVGIRGLLAISTMDMDRTNPALPKNMLFSTEDAVRENAFVVKTWPFRGEGLVHGCCSLRQIITCSEELIRKITALAEEEDTMVQTHLAEGHYEIDAALEWHGKRPAEYMESIGALTPRLIAAHSVLLSDHEVDLYAKRDVGVAHCAAGNFSGLGATKLPLMRRLGVKIGLGSDGAGSGTIDLFEQMRTVLAIQGGHYGSPYQDRGVISPQEVLEMATIGGARVVGLDDEIGSLEFSKRADIGIYRADGLDVQPSPDPVFTAVRCLSRANLEAVVVNGQVVMRDGQILTVDEAALRQEVAARAPQIQQAFVDWRLGKDWSAG